MSTYTLIQSQTLASSAASVTFSTIPSTFTDLCIKLSLRGDVVNNNDTLQMFFNNDTASIYSRTFISNNDGSTPNSGYNASDEPLLGRYDFNGSTTTSNTFSNTEIYIPNYTSTTKKPVSWTSVFENNSSSAYAAQQVILAGLVNKTVAVTSIKFACNSGPNFVTGSSFYLYGISSS